MSYDALLELFECVGSFLKRLEIYTKISLSPLMTEIIIKIMAEVISNFQSFPGLRNRSSKEGSVSIPYRRLPVYSH